MWNQSFTSSVPSETSMRSKCRMRSSRRSNSARFSSPTTRCRMGSVYHEPKRMPMRPLGGSACQKRHISGRSRSTSVIAPKAWVRMWRGSIHSLKRFTVSDLPAPPTPFTRMITGNFPFSRSLYCRSSRRWRSFGSSRLNSLFFNLWPISADSNTGLSLVLGSGLRGLLRGLLAPEGLALRKATHKRLQQPDIALLARGEPALREGGEGSARIELGDETLRRGRIVGAPERVLQRGEPAHIALHAPRLEDRGEAFDAVAQSLGVDAHLVALGGAHLLEALGAREQPLMALANDPGGELLERGGARVDRRRVRRREPARDLENDARVLRGAQGFARRFACAAPPPRDRRLEQSRRGAIPMGRGDRRQRFGREHVPVARGAEGGGRSPELRSPHRGALLADHLAEQLQRRAHAAQRDACLVHEFRRGRAQHAFLVRLQLLEARGNHPARRAERGHVRIEMDAPGLLRP